MRTDQKKLGELLIWVLLFLACLAGSVYCMVTSFSKDIETESLIVTEENKEDTEEDREGPAERINEDGTKDIPSGVVEQPD